MGHSKLTHKQRKKMRSTSFALPAQRKYPIHDRSHAQNALARVSVHGTEYEKQKVRSAVHRRYPDLPRDWHGKKPK